MREEICGQALGVPRVAAIYLTDVFVLGRTDYQSAALRQTFVLTNVDRLLAFGLGAAIGRGLDVS